MNVVWSHFHLFFLEKWDRVKQKLYFEKQGGVMKRILTVWALLLTACLNLSCVPRKDVLTIRVADFLTDPALIKILNATVLDIENKNPGVQVTLETTPYNDYQQKIITQITADAAPDILYVEANNFVDLYLRDALEDLTPYAQKDQVDLKVYYPSIVKRFSPNGKIFAIPQDIAPAGLMYYNKKIFQEAGVPFPTGDWSWPKDFLDVCQKLVKKDATGKVVRWAYDEAYPINFENFIFSNGGDWVDNTEHPTRFMGDSPRALEAARFRWDLIHTYHVAPSVTEMQSFSFGGGVQQMFVNGQIAMMASGIWHVPQLLKAKDLDFDVVEFPKGPKGLKGWSSGGSGYAICKSSKHKDLAWQIIRQLAAESSISGLAATGMIQPALIKLANSDTFLKSPGPANKGILLKMTEYSHFSPFFANWGEIYYGVLGPALDPVWMGKTTPEKVLPGITKKINDKFFKAKNK